VALEERRNLQFLRVSLGHLAQGKLQGRCGEETWHIFRESLESVDVGGNFNWVLEYNAMPYLCPERSQTKKSIIWTQLSYHYEVKSRRDGV